MAGWLANKLRGGRYSVNLQLLEADLAGSSTRHQAAVLVAAATMIEKLSVDDSMTRALLARAVLEPFGTTSEAAQDFYNALEDVLNATEAQRKQVTKHMAGRLGADEASDLNQQLKIQQQGIRLLLVALARKVDDSFKAKAGVLRESLYEARGAIDAAVTELAEREHLTSGVAPLAQPLDSAGIKVKAELFAFACVGW